MNRRDVFKALAAIAIAPMAFVAAKVRRIWHVGTSAELHYALRNANPEGGDTIILAAGRTYEVGPVLADLPRGKDFTYIVSGASDNGTE